MSANRTSQDPELLRRLLRAKDKMDAASHEEWPVRRLARVSGVSEAHFARSFKQAFGVPPHRYLLTRRVERARALLRETDLAVTDIGRLFLAMNAAMLAASLALGVVVDRHGLRTPMAVGALLVAGGLLIVAHAASTQALLSGVIALGAGGGALNGAANILVADLHQDERRKSVALNRLGVFFGIGAVVMPFSVSFLTARLK